MLRNMIYLGECEDTIAYIYVGIIGLTGFIMYYSKLNARDCLSVTN